MATTHLPDLISLAPPGGADALYLESMAVRGTVAGNNCLTEMILTFKNNTSRTLEGELNFPLPLSGVVSGFGYEINGNMVDGVIVEKEAARVAFEKEVRSGGKAALVEHVQGNAFKTRVYPIQPNKPISVKVVYLSDVEVNSDGASYSLPLCISKPLKSLSLHLEIRGNTPVVREADEGLTDLKFTATGNDFASDVELQNFKSKKNLLIGLSAVGKASEPQVLSSLYDSDAYFIVHDVPAEAAVAPSSTAMLKSVAVVWDASLSMETVSKKRVLKVLGDLFALPALQGAKATLILFRQATEAAIEVQSGQELLAKLNAVEYDGGTDLANLRWLGAQAEHKRTCTKGHALTLVKPSYEASRWNCDGCAFAKDQETESWHCAQCGYDLCSVCYSEPPSGLLQTPYDKILLVTDGFSNLSDDMPSQIPTSPIIVLNIGTQSNALSLTAIANKTGGQFLDLTRIPDDNIVLQAITSSSKFSFLSATFDAKDFADVLPSQPQPILAGEKFTCAGKLLRGSGTITINYGVGGKVTASRQVTVSRAASENGLVAKLWAGMKVKELSVFAAQNKQEMLTIGRKYGIVTPGASILVLSDVDAYLKHGIEPSAKGLPDVHKAYTAQQAEKKRSEDARITSKVNTVLGWWRARVAWYERDFSAILASKHRANWETTMRAENPKLFQYSSAPPALPPAPSAHTARMSDADADAHVAAHPPPPRRSFKKEKKEEKEREESEDRFESKKLSRVSESKSKKMSKSEMASPVMASMSSFSRPVDEGDMLSNQSASLAPSMERMRRQSSGEDEELALEAEPTSMSMGDVAPPPPAMAESAPAPAPPPSAQSMSAGPRPSAPAPAPARASSAARPGAPPASPSTSAPAPAAPNPDDDGQTASGIAVKAWTPDMPYLNAIKKEAKTEQYAAYLKQRQAYRSSPAFYLDVATYFFSEAELKQYGHRVLTSIADLGLEDPGLLRIVGYKLTNEGLHRQAAAVFGRVLRLREYEPQSWRDLGNVLADLGLYERSLECFWKVVTGAWDSNYSEVELTVLMEANRVIDIVQRRKLTVKNPVDERLIYNMHCDLRISCGWDTNNTDVDLHVREPDGTECYYGNKNTPTGGLVSRDFTRGYGPEEYMIKFGLPGTYIIKVRYYASTAQTLSGGTTVLLNVFTDFARGEYERCQKTTVRLQQSCDNFEVARIDFAPSGPRKTKLRGLEEDWGREFEQRAAWAEQWEAYNQRQSEIQQWQRDEQNIVSSNQASINAATERYHQAAAQREQQSESGKNLAVPAKPEGGSSPSTSPRAGGSGKGLSPGAPPARAPSPGKSLSDKIIGIFKH